MDAEIALIAGWKTSVEAMVENADNYVRLVTFPGGEDWSGLARDAAVGVAGSDRTAVGHVRTAVDTMAETAMASLKTTVREHLKKARDAIKAAEDGPDPDTGKVWHFKVEEVLGVVTVTDPSATVSLALPDNDRPVALEKFQTMIPPLVKAWWDADQGVAAQIARDRGGLAPMFNKLAVKAAPVSAVASLPSVSRAGLSSRDAGSPAGLATVVGGKPISELLPGIDPAAAKPAAGVPGNPAALLDKALHPKAPADPNAGRLIDTLARVYPSALDTRSRVEKTPGIDPNSPAGKTVLDGLRLVYQGQHLPPEQIEAKLAEQAKLLTRDKYNVVFADPNNVLREPTGDLQRPLGDRINEFVNGISDSASATADGQIQEVKNLAGLGGPGQPGAAQAWKDLGVGVAKGTYEMATNPVGVAYDEAKAFLDDPAKYIGQKMIEVPEALATLPAGGEGAALTEARALTTHGLGEVTHVPPSAINHHVPSVDHGPVDHRGHADTPNVDHHGGAISTEGSHHPYGGDVGAVEPRPYNENFDAYPRAYHPGTGEEMPFPTGDLDRVPRDQRSEWTNMDRYYYIKQWHDMGYEEPPGGWNLYDIHHIRPREFGGDNSFENLIPVPRPLHNQRITPWWNNYE